MINHLSVVILVLGTAYLGYADPFTVSQYNILAKYLGSNHDPWFLYPLDLTTDERAAIQKNYGVKVNGSYPNVFENGYGGLLTPKQIEEVKKYDADFDWTSRGPKIFDISRKLDADIMSFVELDVYEELADTLRQDYDSRFFKRPRPSSKDGCGLFWRRSRFEIVGKPTVMNYKDVKPGDLENERLDRVLIAVALRDKHDGNIIVVVSTHLMRNPEDESKDPVRMCELSQMMSRISCLIAEVNATGLIVAGDLNSLPNSWAHMMLLREWRECPGSEKAMADALAKLEGTGCTTRTNARTMWIDYIFYSGASLILENVQVEECPDAPMPNAQHPSDHLPVKATFSVRPGVQSLVHCGSMWAQIPYGTASVNNETIMV